MNDLQLHIYQLLKEMDSLEDTPEGVDKAHLAQPAKNDQSENDKDTPERLDKGQLPEAAKEANVEKSNKPVSHKKEKFLTLSSKPITLGKRSTSTPQEIEEKPEIENLLHIVETPRGLDKGQLPEAAKETESIKDKE